MEKTLKKYRKLFVEIRRCRRRKILKQLRLLQEEQRQIRPKVERYIKDIKDPVKRLIFYERVLQGESWQSVACILGGGNTADGVRKQYKRYFKSENQN